MEFVRSVPAGMEVSDESILVACWWCQVLDVDELENASGDVFGLKWMTSTSNFIG